MKFIIPAKFIVTIRKWPKQLVYHIFTAIYIYRIILELANICKYNIPLRHLKIFKYLEY